MLIIDRTPCHGYEIRRRLQPLLGDIEITRLYRILKQMEEEGLIVCSETEGPHGPSRRVYSKGEKGERYLRRLLRDSMRTIFHFYEAFSDHMLERSMQDTVREELHPCSGKILVCNLSPYVSVGDSTLNLIRERAGESGLYVVGDTLLWEQSGVKCGSVKGEPWDLSVRSNSFAEYWLLGTPPRAMLPGTICEAKRVLIEDGVFHLNAGLVFLNEVVDAGLESFIKNTAVMLFPELGVVDGEEICEILGSQFSKHGTVVLSPGLVQFWAMKHSE
ncbi:MAG: PadR family transcriptional regulator [Candidatus Thorarchaeota archaeon]|nr:PadR family transcriptional regulator [Candidatus Thorarchaeota archaeon]